MSLLDDAQESWEHQPDATDVPGRDIYLAGYLAGVRAVAEQLNDNEPEKKYKNFDYLRPNQSNFSVVVRLDQAYMAQLNDLLGRDPQEHW
jgi:hypothetical protein